MRGHYFEEMAQRRERNHVGRYAIQVQVEFLTGPMTGSTHWIALTRCDELWTQQQAITDQYQQAAAL